MIYLVTKVVERICLVLWAITMTSTLSCLGLGMMILSINIGFRSMGQAGQMETESIQMIVGGIVTLPLAFYARYFGVKHLHFLEHDDGGFKIDDDP